MKTYEIPHWNFINSSLEFYMIKFLGFLIVFNVCFAFVLTLIVLMWRTG